MPIPQPGQFTRSEEAPGDAFPCQQLGVPTHEGQACPEVLGRCRRWGRNGRKRRPVLVHGYLGSSRMNDHEAVGLFALGFAAHAANLRDGVVHHLSLERGHRLQRLGCPRFPYRASDVPPDLAQL